MKRLRLPSLSLIPFLAIALSHFAARGDSQNVLFIAIDDLNDWIGCLDEHPQAKTPNMDRLAARGTLFTNAHCQAPICGPSRGSLLSGRYPHETGLYNQPSGNTLADDAQNFHQRLLPQYFAQNGYATYGVGKITHGYKIEDTFQQYGSKGSAGPKPKGPKAPNDVRFRYRPDYSQPYTGTQTDWGVFPDRDEQMPDFQTAAWAVERLGQTHDKPFFMAVGFHRPHVPFYAPQEWFDLYPLDEVILPEIPNDDLEDVPENGRRIHELPRYPSLDWLRADNDEELRRCVQAYLACISFVDAQVGKVLDALDRSSHADDTLIVLFSDHGYHIGEKGRVSKQGLWEESTRVPMVVSLPGQSKGQVSHRPVGLIDLYPTLIDLCKLPPRSANSGRSLAPLLENPNASWRHSILTTYARGNHTLRSEQYRYIRYDDGSEELYDHDTDPHEWTNLAGNPEFAQVVARFRQELPAKEAPYHPSVRSGPINDWFVEHYKAEGVGE
ncbi:MAG: hypothetical protein CBD18_02610 [Opitutales bacterium TMED158]|nr:MAG: hypothetical protein CBD18_02610 [Opitutales bacterium TMED158]